MASGLSIPCRSRKLTRNSGLVSFTAKAIDASRPNPAAPRASTRRSQPAASVQPASRQKKARSSPVPCAPSSVGAAAISEKYT
eukprot:6593095-Prymnesium_polylepis.1